jgi:hypothetical protein
MTQQEKAEHEASQPLEWSALVRWHHAPPYVGRVHTSQQRCLNVVCRSPLGYGGQLVAAAPSLTPATNSEALAGLHAKYLQLQHVLGSGILLAYANNKAAASGWAW